MSFIYDPDDPDEELPLTQFITPIPTAELTESLRLDWPIIAEHVLDIFDKYPATECRVTCIALFKMGVSEDYDTNPSTVYVSVHDGSEESEWPAPVGEVEAYLGRYNHKLRLHLEHDTSDESCSDEFPLVRLPLAESDIEEKIGNGFSVNRTYDTQVGLGADIGPQRYLSIDGSQDPNKTRYPGLGTLGCWIELKTRREPRWTKYALTSYHVIRPIFDGFQISSNSKGATIPVAPVKGSDCWKVDLHGMSPSTTFTSTPVGIEHPTRTKHNFTVQILERQMGMKKYANKVLQIQTHLSEINSFLDNEQHHLGALWAASGFTRRTKNNGRLDWALIKPTSDERVGTNKLPTGREWQAARLLSIEPDTDEFLKQPPAWGLRSIGNSELIYKVGTSTGPTAGMYNEAKAKVHLPDDAHVQPYMGFKYRSHFSDEFLYTGLPIPARDKWLAKSGDSGSVVFDKDGAAVGLVFRGPHVAQKASSSWAYVTPIEDIFADIKAFSKGGITDIRIAEE
ncbi:hypothetical protein QBC34DRAFT_432654 [Podospora aff. communis PSN243]|uniref:Serine protease n=1 Tax=Podospora aff. communis PSN243 TaxID=3040156 RepID=A0AAV9H2N3_9PEZI|nr:hypothetical protein QBC34DRAFT_432654 [Podospora aff. communis PSN243]